MKTAITFGLLFIFLFSFSVTAIDYGETVINVVSCSSNASGVGEYGYLPYWTNSTNLAISSIFFEPSERFIGIDTGISASYPLDVNGTARFRDWVILDNATTYNGNDYLVLDGTGIIRKRTLPSFGYGNISGEGTSGYVPMFTGTTSINNSIAKQTAGNMEILGDLMLPTVQSATKNTVLVIDTTGEPYSGNISYRQPDTRIWGTTLIDKSGTVSAGHIAYYSDTDSITQDLNQLYWDATNNRLGIGTNAPTSALEVTAGIETRSISDNDATNFFEATCTANQTITNINSQGTATCTAIDMHNGLTLFEADGTYVMPSSATVFNDVYISLLSSALGGANNPDFSTFRTNTKVYEFQDNIAVNQDELFFSFQMPHSYKVNSNFDAHIHWSADANSSGVANFTLECTKADIGSKFAEPATVYEANLSTSGNDAFQHNMTDFTEGLTCGTVSCMMQCKLVRASAQTGDTYPSGIYAHAVDFHIEMDTIGSRSKTTK